MTTLPRSVWFLLVLCGTLRENIYVAFAQSSEWVCVFYVIHMLCFSQSGESLPILCMCPIMSWIIIIVSPCDSVPLAIRHSARRAKKWDNFPELSKRRAFVRILACVVIWILVGVWCLSAILFLSTQPKRTNKTNQSREKKIVGNFPQPPTTTTTSKSTFISHNKQQIKEEIILRTLSFAVSLSRFFFCDCSNPEHTQPLQSLMNPPPCDS